MNFNAFVQNGKNRLIWLLLFDRNHKYNTTHAQTIEACVV